MKIHDELRAKRKGKVDKIWHEELGAEVEHEVILCLDNPIEPSYRGIKQRYYSTLGFAAFEFAKRFCQAYDPAPQFFLTPSANGGIRVFI